MKDVFKETAPWFRVLKKNIINYQKKVEKAKKVAECGVRKAATAAAQAHGCGTGNRGGVTGVSPLLPFSYSWASSLALFILI